MSDADLWFHRPRPNPDAAARIFCLPFAGGRAQIFNGWPEGVPPEVEVVALQLPGRAARVQEDPFERLEPLLEALLEALGPELDRPYYLFGHSMGGLVAFEIAGPLDFSTVGVLSGLLEPLAKQGISILALSTYDTDWILIDSQHADEAMATWKRDGNTAAPARLGGATS